MSKKSSNFKKIIFFLSLALVLSWVGKGIFVNDIKEITNCFGNSCENTNNTFLSNEFPANNEAIEVSSGVDFSSQKKLDIKNNNICLGGQAFGIKMFTKGVIVVGLTDINTSIGAICPADKAGIKKGDIILAVNGIEVNSAENFTEIISKEKNNEINISFIRDDKKIETVVTPVISSKDNCYKIGLWVRDSTAGIGTVTFIDKESGIFGGLGHGVCDVDTGLLMPFERGTVVEVKINGAVKGEPNNPGELKGVFEKETIGELYSNTNSGVFGKLSKENAVGEVIQLGNKKEVCEGNAYIYTTISGEKPEKYEARIIKILDDSRETKNFMIEITDKKLLHETGGIVQGMSGSPIIQNDKLVGAVTHVLVNNPEKGYGIFIENMISNVS